MLVYGEVSARKRGSLDGACSNGCKFDSAGAAGSRLHGNAEEEDASAHRGASESPPSASTCTFCPKGVKTEGTPTGDGKESTAESCRPSCGEEEAAAAGHIVEVGGFWQSTLTSDGGEVEREVGSLLASLAQPLFDLFTPE